MQHKTAAYGWISLKWVSFCFWSFKNHVKQYIYRCLENATANRCVNESMDNVFTLLGRCRMRSYREMSAHNFPLRCLSGLSAWKHSIFLLMVRLVTRDRLCSTVCLHVCVVRWSFKTWVVEPPLHPQDGQHDCDNPVFNTDLHMTPVCETLYRGVPPPLRGSNISAPFQLELWNMVEESQ